MFCGGSGLCEAGRGCGGPSPESIPEEGSRRRARLLLIKKDSCYSCVHSTAKRRHERRCLEFVGDDAHGRARAAPPNLDRQGPASQQTATIGVVGWCALQNPLGVGGAFDHRALPFSFDWPAANTDHEHSAAWCATHTNPARRCARGSGLAAPPDAARAFGRSLRKQPVPGEHRGRAQRGEHALASQSVCRAHRFKLLRARVQEVYATICAFNRRGTLLAVGCT